MRKTLLGTPLRDNGLLDGEDLEELRFEATTYTENILSILNNDKTKLIEDFLDIVSKNSKHSNVKDFYKFDYLKLSEENAFDLENIFKLFAVRNIIAINHIFRKLFTYTEKEFENGKKFIEITDTRFSKIINHYNTYRGVLSVLNSMYIFIEDTEEDYLLSSIYRRIAKERGFDTLTIGDIKILSEFILTDFNDLSDACFTNYLEIYLKIFSTGINPNRSIQENGLGEIYFSEAEDNYDNKFDSDVIDNIAYEGHVTNLDTRLFNITSSLLSKLVNELNIQMIINSLFLENARFVHKKGEKIEELMNYCKEEIRQIDKIFDEINSDILRILNDYMIFNESNVVKNTYRFSFENLLSQMQNNVVRDTYNELSYKISFVFDNVSLCKCKEIYLKCINEHRMGHYSPYVKIDSDLNDIYVFLKFNTMTLNKYDILEYLDDFGNENEILSDMSLMQYYTYNLSTGYYCDTIVTPTIDDIEDLKKLNYLLDFEYTGILDSPNEAITTNIFDSKLLMVHPLLLESIDNNSENVDDVEEVTSHEIKIFDNLFDTNLYAHNNAVASVILDTDAILYRDKTGNIPCYWQLFDENEYEEMIKEPEDYRECNNFFNNFSLNGFRNLVKEYSKDENDKSDCEDDDYTDEIDDFDYNVDEKLVLSTKENMLKADSTAILYNTVDFISQITINECYMLIGSDKYYNFDEGKYIDVSSFENFYDLIHNSIPKEFIRKNIERIIINPFNKNFKVNTDEDKSSLVIHALNENDDNESLAEDLIHEIEEKFLKNRNEIDDKIIRDALRMTHQDLSDEEISNRIKQFYDILSVLFYIGICK